MAIKWVLRDKMRRLVTAEYEIKRQALRLIINDQRHPMQVRIKAQLELQKLPGYSRPSAIRNRCTVVGKARSVFPDMKMCQTAFRELALAGDLPGIKKSIW